MRKRKRQEAEFDEGLLAGAGAGGAGMRPTAPIGFADDRALAEARAEAARAIQEARTEADRILREAGTDAARIQAGAVATGDHPTAGPGPVAAGSGASPGAQALPRDFIHRERTFLQNLAELIQSHAEAVRQDARRSRGGGPGP